MKTALTNSLVVLCLVIAVSDAARSQSSTETGDRTGLTAEQVLEKNIAAIGGREKIEKDSSYYMKAALEMPRRGVRGTLEVWGKAPNKLLTVTTIDRVGEISQGYDGKVGWSKDPYQGLRVLDGAELEKIKYQAIFNSELKWRELFHKVELAGMEQVDEREAYVLRLTGKDGWSVTKYYDKETFLLVRVDVVDEGPHGKIPIETRYSNYRELDGVRVAFEWTQKTPVGETVIKILEAKSNVPIDDSRFANPQ